MRTIVWSVALALMGIACILNAQQCGRTHCRYTGPYYLAMIVPVAVVGLGLAPLAPHGWIALGILILGGGYVIWWATERVWGKFAGPYAFRASHLRESEFDLELAGFDLL